MFRKKMAGSKDRNLSTGKTPTVSSWNQTRVLYLTAYNSLFVVLWSWILFNAIRNSTKEKHELFLATEPRARWTQTAALVEVLHAALGRHYSHHRPIQNQLKDTKYLLSYYNHKQLKKKERKKETLIHLQESSHPQSAPQLSKSSPA